MRVTTEDKLKIQTVQKLKTIHKQQTTQNKTKLAWFSHLLQHSARKRGGLFLQRSRAHKGHVYRYSVVNWFSVQLCVKALVTDSSGCRLFLCLMSGKLNNVRGDLVASVRLDEVFLSYMMRNQCLSVKEKADIQNVRMFYRIDR